MLKWHAQKGIFCPGMPGIEITDATRKSFFLDQSGRAAASGRIR
jgi:hypothetical protein